MAISSLISYQRAKAESLGLDAKGGLMERAERVVLLCIGLLFEPLLVPVLWLMLALTAITAGQRFVKVWRQAQVAPVTAGAHRTAAVPPPEPAGGAQRASPHPRAPASLLTVSAPAGDEVRATVPASDGCGDVRRPSARPPASRRALPNFAADGFAIPIGVRRQRRQRRAPGDDRAPPPPRRPVVRGWRAAPSRAGLLRLLLPLLDRELPAPVAAGRASSPPGSTSSGFEHVTAGLAKGRGVILALPHLGGWEWAGRWLADQGHRTTVIVEQLEPPELFDWFVRLRSDLGMTVVPLGPDAGRAVLKALADNEIVCLLCDRDIQGGGIEVEFFGERTTLPAGPAMLALRADAPLLPVGVYFTTQVNGHHAVVRPPLPTAREGRLRDDVARVTQ